MAFKPLAKTLVAVMLGSASLLSATEAQAFSFQSVLQWISTLQSEMSAWAVTVKQTAVSANQEADSYRISNQQLATAIGALDMSNRVSKALMSVDATYGQPVTIKCTAQKNATMQVEARHQMMLDKSKLMETYASTRVASNAIAERERVALHKDSYCTISEAQSGLCTLKPNGMQGWDVNYGGAFGEATLPAEGELAGYAYTAMVADVRAPAALDCKSSACASAAQQSLANAAMGSMVSNAFLGQVMERRVPMLTGQ